MKRIIVVLASLMFLTSSVFAAQASDEVNARFTYKGKPIHPFLLGEFINNMSDDQSPIVVSVDIAAALDSNEYPSDEVKWKYDQWMAEHLEEDGEFTNYEAYGYKWHGKMANNIHAVEIGWSGGGSGYFMNLLFVRFSEDTVKTDGEERKQILMSVVRIYSLGDRYDGSIKVYPDKVIIGVPKSLWRGGPIEKTVEVRIP